VNPGGWFALLAMQQSEEERRHQELLTSLSRPAPSVPAPSVFSTNRAPDPGAQHAALGWEYYQKGRYERALNQFARAIDEGVSPESSVWDGASHCLARLGRLQEAEDACTEWFELQEDPEALRRRGWVRYRLRRYADALADLDAALVPGSSLDDTAFECQVRAWCLEGLGRTDEAIDALNAGIDGWPEDASLHALRAKMLSHQDRTDEAAAAIEVARRLEPDSVTVESAAAAVAAQRSDWSAVIAAGQRLHELAPSGAGGWYWSGLGYRHQRAFPEAVSDLEHALQLMPGLVDCEFELACALTQLGRRAEASAHLKVAVNSEFGEKYRKLARTDPDLRQTPGSQPRRSSRNFESKLAQLDKPGRITTARWSP